MNRVLVYGMTENRGGIESFVINMFRNRPDDFIFDFVVDWEHMAFEEEVKKAGARVFHITKKSENLKKQWTEFSEILEKHPEYQIVYFNLMNAGTVLNMRPAHQKKRLIVAHSHNGSTTKVAMHRMFRPLLNRISDKRFACGKLASDFMFGKSHAKDTEIIYNAIDLESFQYNTSARERLRKEYHLEDCFTVLHVGRMNVQKNPLFMLSVFKEILKKEPSAKLIYIGEGEMKQEVMDFAMGNQLSDHILFLGIQSNVNEWLSASDAFLLPSLFEGLPVTLVEAQTANIPVFCSDVISDEAVLSEHIHFLKLEDSPENWAKEVLKVKGYERTSIVSDSLKNAYDTSRTGKKFWDLLRKMTEEKGKSNERN